MKLLLQKLPDCSYLKRNMLIYTDRTTTQQLKDCTIKVNQKHHKRAISKIFTTKLKFAADYLNRYFKKNIES